MVWSTKERNHCSFTCNLATGRGRLGWVKEHAQHKSNQTECAEEPEARLRRNRVVHTFRLNNNATKNYYDMVAYISGMYWSQPWANQLDNSVHGRKMFDKNATHKKHELDK